jgi:hypothetical protein
MMSGRPRFGLRAVNSNRSCLPAGNFYNQSTGIINKPY